MLTIRFQRIGKKKKPFYRVIISEKGRDTQGHYLEQLGSYNPHTKAVQFKNDRITYWLGVGAQMSNSVYNLFMREGLIPKGDKRRSVTISNNRRAKLDQKKAQSEAAAKAQEAAPAPEAAAPTEAPVETPETSA